MISLGIDTSNYTTSVSVCEDGKILNNFKYPLKVKEGERGLRQSDAVFLHIKNFTENADCLKGIKPDVISYSATPRDIPGSYMPCFLVGKAVAQTLSAILDCPIYSFSHQAGHLRSALYSSGREDLVGKEYLAFHVSGGTTELLHVSGNNIEIIGKTLDLTAGQAIDRTAVKLGLGFPGGPNLSAVTDIGEKTSPKISVKGCDCNIAGVENIVDKMIKEGREKGFIAKYLFDFIQLTLAKMYDNALVSFGNLDLICAGGVMSNTFIKSYFIKHYPAYFADPEFSSDNAAGIALLGYDMCEKNAV